MKVFRFMSHDELMEYLVGNRLYNDTVHKARTDSIGFCFLDIKDFTPEYAYKFLIGAIYPQVCAIFEVNENRLKKGYGVYHKPGGKTFDVLKTDEYSTKEYGRSDFKLIKYTDCNLFQKYLLKEDFEWRKE